MATMDTAKFAECCSALYLKWEVEKTLGRNCDGLVIVSSNREHDSDDDEPLSRYFALSAGMWQLKHSEWIMAFTEGCIFVLATSERAKTSIKSMVDDLPQSFVKRVEVLTRDKADKNKSNFGCIVAGLKASKRGSRVGCILQDKTSGSFAASWESVLRDSGLEVADVTDDMWQVVSAHRRPEATCVAASDAESDGEVESSGKKRKAPEKAEKTATVPTSKLQESLLRALECSVCMNIMVASVYQCQFGHSICKVCVEKVTKCPMCRCDMRTRIRNLALEQMAEGMGGFLCMHAGQGCKQVVQYSHLEEHQRICGFGPVSCPWAWYRRTGPRPCNWQGPASQLTEHLHNKHSERSSKLNMEPPSQQVSAAHHKEGWSHRVLIQSPQQSYTANFEAILDHRNPHEKVFFRMDHRGKDQMSFTCVRYIGVSPSVTASGNDWFCELTAGRYSKQDPADFLSRRAMWCGRVHSVGHTPRELRDAGEGLFVQANQVRLLAEKEKTGDTDGTNGSVLIHLRFFRDKEAAGKLGLPPLTDHQKECHTQVDTNGDPVTSESGSHTESDREFDEQDDEALVVQSSSATPQVRAWVSREARRSQPSSSTFPRTPRPAPVSQAEALTSLIVSRIVGSQPSRGSGQH